MKRFPVLILALFFPIFASAAIENPYVVDEKPRVLFGDSVEWNGHYGLENYAYEYVNGYLHITFTYTHGPFFPGYPPVLYITGSDPRSTSTPEVIANEVILELTPFSGGIGAPSGWYTYDIQFYENLYHVTIKLSGVSVAYEFDKSYSGSGDNKWAALANNHPNVGDNQSMAFTPVPVKETGPVEECCSSVLFLPGMKGSVLKMGSDTLWPATFFGNDLPALALTEEGESVNNVYVDGILQEFANADIYLPFSTFLDGLVSETLINDWLPMAYDWRFSPEKILADGVKTESETIDIIEEIEELASSSQTGQVTIVAHSMGGLMGKAIIKELEALGKDDLIDSFVMVGTPQLGTPQAIGALLHGYDEDILGGFVVGPAQARTVSQNMQSAYNLLPSRKYFEEVIDPVITFDPQASFTQEWRDFWGEDGINDYSGFSSFLTATGVTRERPGELDLRNPEVLRADLVNTADETHQVYDNYALPSHIRTVQVAGWGFPTVKAIHYRNRHGQPSYDVAFTVEGDKTVVYKSAIASVGETYFFDLATYNSLEDTPDFQHRSVLNSLPIQDLIKTIVEENDVTTNSFVRITKPLPDDVTRALIVSAHSPVILGVYDEFNNFTGIDPNQDLSAEILSITEDIPGSAFLYTSESQYIFLPKEGLYNFVYTGIDNGSTTIEIKDFTADVVTPITAYSDISTTELTTATFTVNSENPDTTIIKLDTDSDGELDEIIVSDDADIYDLLALLKDKIKSLNIKEKLKVNLLKKIENLEKKIEKKKAKDKSLETIKKKVGNLIKRILKKEEKSVVSEADAQEIIKLLEQIENAI
ncbi:MAG: hypothetical protein WBL19_01695 [Minisyncoccia bacterium]